MHFSLTPVQPFRKPLLLESRLPRSADLDAARFGYYQVATLDTETHRWEVVPSGYDPSTHMLVTDMPHFSYWTVTQDVAKDAKIVAGCIPDAITGGASGFLKCLAKAQWH